MFLAEPSDELRQGDISLIEGYPLYDFSKSGRTTQPGATPNAFYVPDWDKVAPPGEDGALVAICTHDCDAENTRTRTGILVAPLIRPPATKGKEVGRYEAIMASADPEIENEVAHFTYINFFPIVLPNGDEWVLDLSAMVTLAPSARAQQELQAAKQHEMTDETRKKFRWKLAALLGRGE